MIFWGVTCVTVFVCYLGVLQVWLSWVVTDMALYGVTDALSPSVTSAAFLGSRYLGVVLVFLE